MGMNVESSIYPDLFAVAVSHQAEVVVVLGIEDLRQYGQHGIPLEVLNDWTGQTDPSDPVIPLRFNFRDGRQQRDFEAGPDGIRSVIGFGGTPTAVDLPWQAVRVVVFPNVVLHRVEPPAKGPTLKVVDGGEAGG